MKISLALLTSWSSAALAVQLQPDGTCPLVTFIPFTDLRAGPPDEINKEGAEIYGYGQWSSPAALGKASFSLMAAAQMAKDHFNQRDSSVVPDLENYKNCSITFPDNDWFVNSAYSRSVVVDELINITRNADDPDNVICAVIGPLDARANEGASVITEFLNIPQIAYETIDRRLARKLDFPTFVRGIPVATDFARTAAEYLQRDIWIRDYVGVIYAQSDYGEQFEDPMENAENDLGYKTKTEHVLEDDIQSMYDSLGECVSEGYHTIFFAADRPAILDDLAEVGEDLGIIGEDYVWFFTGDILPPELLSTTRFEVDSPADKVLRGAALLTNYDPFVYKPEGDAFLDAWKKQGDELLERLREMHPLDPSDPGYFAGEAGYFQEEVPTEYASFLYDAIMNAGMSACRSLESSTDHIVEVFKSDFQGASGHTSFKSGQNTRSTAGVKFGVYNVRPGPIDEATNTRGYTRHLTAVYDGTEGKWSPVEGEEFLFFDGTAEVPTPNRETTDWNFLSKNIRIVGFVFIGLSLFIILLSALWIFVRRKERIVTASQPQFLYLLCLGAALQALSLIFLSFDESYGWTDSQLDKACAAFPWFFVIGYLVQYCAIFSKLWRLSKLLSLRRRAVEFKQVLLPFALIITSSLVILIVWQVVDPLQWNRELQRETDDDGLLEVPWVSYGQCESAEKGVLPFVIPLAFLFAVIMSMTLAISWKMKDVQEELSEARWIFIAIFSHLQIWAIGIPVYWILQDVSRDAAYLISMALIVVFSNVFVILVIWPKMIGDIRKNVFGGGASPPTRQSRISIAKPSTYVSGLKETSTSQNTESYPKNGPPSNNNFSSATKYNDEKLKILSLEAEIQDLKAALEEKGAVETAPLVEPMDAECEPREADDSGNER